VKAAERIAYVGVGSNLDPETNIVSVARRLTDEVRLLAVSTFYWTAAVGGAGQARFLNGAFAIGTVLPPAGLKLLLRRIEAEFGRVRGADRNAPRPIDLDILVYDDVIVEEGEVRLPHPEIEERAFLAVPLLELAPGIVLPGRPGPLAQCAVARATAGLDPAPGFTARLRAAVARARLTHAEERGNGQDPSC